MADILKRKAKIYVAGHLGLVGSAFVKRLKSEGFSNLILRNRKEVDLKNREEVFSLFKKEEPEYVIIAAAKVGGIAANVAEPTEFLVDNLKIQNNLLEACLEYRVIKTVFLGSSCIYPRESRQPMRESCFMTGPLEPTNESYAIAKIAGIRLAQAMHLQYGLKVLCPMPSNLYGAGDHFEFERSHVISALVRRFAEAKQCDARSVTLWGSGHARREFLHVDDCVDACLFLMRHMDTPEIINVGTGEDYSIYELAETVSRMAGYTGNILWDESKPDGMPRKLLDVTKLHALGWRHRIGLECGLKMVFDDFYQWQNSTRG